MENLWNKTNKKTRAVVYYIDNLEPYSEDFNVKKFDEIIEEALDKNTPDEMLECVGYRYNQQPTIFERCKL